jgi:hypothetical protein
MLVCWVLTFVMREVVEAEMPAAVYHGKLRETLIYYRDPVETTTSDLEALYNNTAVLTLSNNMAHRDSTASEASLQLVDPAPVPDSRHSSIALPPSGQPASQPTPPGWASRLGLTGGGHSSVYYCL